MSEEQSVIGFLTMDAKDYRVLAHLTKRIFDFAKLRAINLQPAFEKNQSAWKELSAQLKIHLGLCEEYPYINARGESATKVEYIGVAREWTRTQQSNFSHLLKKSTKAAAGLIELGASVEMDTRNGTLILVGAEVEKVFGSAKVLVNERSYRDSRSRVSYLGLARIAEESRVGSDQPSSQKRYPSSLSEDAHLEEICENFLSVLSAFRRETLLRQSRALQAVQEAIAELLGSPSLKRE